MTLEDIQSQISQWGIPIDQVGVSDLRLPLTIKDRAKGVQQVVARVSASVNLPHHFKGTHMSRFIEALNAHRDEAISIRNIRQILQTLRTRLEAEGARLELRFPYFLERTAPVSNAVSLMDYDCAFIGELHEAHEDFILGVDAPVASLCPCSKAISDYGAHNQRGRVAMRVRSRRRPSGAWERIWIEELVEIAEQAASSPVYSLLKRPDERHVTMQMYNNPAFVEDIVRDVARRLMHDSRVAWFEVNVTTLESIHNHNAFARVEWRRDAQDAG